jgi:signal peptidase I
MSLTTALPLTGTSPSISRPGISRGAGRRTVRVVSTVVTVLVSVVAALAIVLSVASRMSPGGQAMVFGHPVMSMLSGSMTGTINTGDLFVDDQLSAAQARDLHVGQVITFREQPGSTTLITHRIVAVKTIDGTVNYITKGDANNAADATPRPASDVVGLFSFAIPRGGYVLAALRQPKVLGLLIASVVLFFLAGSLFSVANGRKNQDSTNT